jgi:hypothetical protein
MTVNNVNSSGVQLASLSTVSGSDSPMPRLEVVTDAFEPSSPVSSRKPSSSDLFETREELEKAAKALKTGCYGWAKLKCTDGTYRVDKLTGDIYNTDPLWAVRLKGLGLTFLTSILYPANVLVSCFYSPKPCKEGVNALGEPIKFWHTLASPVTSAFLPVAALTTVFLPENGRKLYGKLESGLVLGMAPCFRPIGNVDDIAWFELAQRDQRQHRFGITIGGTRW